MPQLQKPEYKPSPLSTAPSRRPPAGTQSENPSPSPFVNPADTYSKARAADNYLWQVVRRLQGYRYRRTSAPPRASPWCAWSSPATGGC